MMPHRVAIALQADGWYVRMDIVWAKDNPMPESVTDRPTKSHEYVFLLSKSEHYYYDAEAVREPNSDSPVSRDRRNRSDVKAVGANGLRGTGWGQDATPKDWSEISGRNLRSVWNIPTEAYPGAHFATYPRKLVSPCIRAGTSQKGCCPRCGAPWRRVVEKATLGIGYTDHANDLTEGMSRYAPQSRKMNDRALAEFRARHPIKTLGWQPTCSHGLEPVPAIVFDPFIGSGTTIIVANALGRHGIGCDLSAEYLGLARRRIERPHAGVPRPRDEAELPLFAGLADDPGGMT
jgi:DNA modification methylase